jgi:hypothetical protein
MVLVSLVGVLYPIFQVHTCLKTCKATNDEK